MRRGPGQFGGSVGLKLRCLDRASDYSEFGPQKEFQRQSVGSQTSRALRLEAPLHSQPGGVSCLVSWNTTQ